MVSQSPGNRTETHPGSGLLRTLQIGVTATVTRGGGLDRYYFDLLRELPLHRIAVHGLVTGSAPGGMQNERIIPFAPDSHSLPRRWSALRRNVRRLVPNVDVAVSHFALYGFPVLDFFQDMPFIVHFHGSWAMEGAAEDESRVRIAAKRAIERAVYARGDRFVVLSQAAGFVLEKNYGIPPEAMRVVPGGVDLHRFTAVGSRSEARVTLGWALDRPTVLTVGRLIRAKGLDRFIDACQTVRRAIPDLQAFIVGAGPLGSELQRRVEEAGLSKWVRLVGYLTDVDLPLAYRAADLLVLPTNDMEGFGLVVIEALACGTPVVVTPVGALPELVSGLDPNLTLEGSDVNTIAQGVLFALRNPSRLPSEDACVLYAQRFGWPEIAERVSQVYREGI